MTRALKGAIRWFAGHGSAARPGWHLPGGQADATQIVAAIPGDPAQAARTWVVITEAMEGGWGIDGHAYGKGETLS
jgi:hypothetical protein